MKNTKTVQTPSRQARFRARLMAVAVSSCFAATAQAAGESPTVVAGSATFSQSGNTTTVTNSNGAIINWKALSVLAGEKLVFDQAANSSVLNRVIGMNVNGKWVIDPTVIAGTISSPGSVWIINSAGIMAKQGAVIDVGRFVASTLDISNANFLAGKLLFDANPGAGAVTVESGASIKTPSGGSVYLIGSSVSNNGIITTPEGETILAAGEKVSIIDSGTPGVKVEITGTEGNVTNLGTVLAEAGRIGMAGALVRNSGTLNASSVVKEGGRVFLKASKDAYVDGNGRIVTTGTKGGAVEVLGNRVAVMDNASIDASGKNGGGTVLVGGDYQGKNPDVQNSTVTYFGKNASIKADASDNGNGGKVILWADDTTRAYGSISARGGANGGNGGFVETSGHRYLAVSGAKVDTRAPKGKTGTWLLDPTDITITHGDAGSASFDGGIFATSDANSSSLTDGDINAALADSDVLISTTSGGAGSGNITVQNGVNISFNPYEAWSVNSLTLHADNNIDFNGAATNGISVSGVGLNLQTTGGTVTLNGVRGSNLTSLSIVTNGGNVTLNNSRLVTMADIEGPSPISGNADILLSTEGNQGTLVLRGAGSGSGGIASIEAEGNLTVSASTVALYGGSAGTGNRASLSSYGTQTISVDNLSLYGGAAGENNHASVISYGGQTITAVNSIALYGGLTGNGNSAIIGSYGFWGQFNDQTINTNRIWLQGGGSQATDFNNRALIESSGGVQTINIKGSSGSIVIYGGHGGDTAASYGGGGLAGASYDSECNAQAAGYCYGSYNAAEIRHEATLSVYGQTISFEEAGGSIAMYGGTGGAGNSARISNRSADNSTAPGAQLIGDVNAPSIYLQGGSSGGKVVYGSDGEWYDIRNAANIDSDSSYMTVNATSLTMVGGGGVSGALIGGSSPEGTSTVTVNVSGDLTMTGGSSGAATAFNDQNKTTNFASPVGIGSDKNDTVVVSADNIHMTSGANAGGQVLIGSLDGATTIYLYANNNISLTSNGALVAIGSLAKEDVGDSMISMGAGGNITTSIGSAAGANVVVGANVGPADVSISSDGDVSLGQVNAGSGDVTITAAGAITDANGSSINVTAGSVSMVSHDGRKSGSYAIDVDTAASSISARVGCSGVECPPQVIYGGIRISNHAAPTSISLRDYSTSGGNISFRNESALITASTLTVSTRSGDVAVTTDGDLDLRVFAAYSGPLGPYGPYEGPYVGPHEGPYVGGNIEGGRLSYPIAGNSFLLTSVNGDITGTGSTFTAQTSSGAAAALALAAKNIALSGTSVTGSSVSLVGENSVTLSNNATVQATSGNVTVVAPTINIIGSQVLSYGNLFMVGGNINASDYSRIAAGYDGTSVTNTNANVSMTAAGDVVLNNGVTVESGNDTTINLHGAASKLYLNQTSGMAATKIISDVATQVPATTHVNFLTGTGGGVVIDGATTTTTVAGGSGFYVLDGSTVAGPGNGLDVAYFATGTTQSSAATNTVISALSQTTKENNLTVQTSWAGTQLSAPSASLPSDKQTPGGEDNSFGSDDKKTNKEANSESSKKKDDNNGKSTSKNQCS